MSESQVLLLGFIAGVTILIGLPIGRLRSPSKSLSQFLNALAIGVLLFLIWDVLTHAFEPVDLALAGLHQGTGGFAPVLGYGSLFLVGIGTGLFSLVYYERWVEARAKPQSRGPGAMARGEFADRRFAVSGLSPERRLAFLIAVGIGLHNFGEGLAIGGSAASGAIELATVLVIGFALHNATEGFGIVAPMASTGDRPSWAFLLLLALIGGGPTFLGTVVGSQFTSEALGVVFLSLAAGSILYVVIQLLWVAQKSGAKIVLYWGVMVGLAAGFITDMVVSAGGA